MAAPSSPRSDSDATYTVRIANTGDSYRCRADQTVLGGMEALGRRGIPVGCRGGGCGVCKVRVESGAVDTRHQKMSRAHVSDDERQHGLLLACRAWPRGDLVVRAVDRLARAFEHGTPRPSTNFLEAARTVAPQADPLPPPRQTP